MGIFDCDTVTVFNHHLDPETEKETWIPTVLKNVYLIISHGTNVSKSGLSSADHAKLFVDFGSTTKPYVDPVSYRKMTLEEKQNNMTFTPQTDFFVKGDLSAVEIMENGFFEWILSNYADAFRITDVDIFDKVLPHFEVGGK